jgi:hypothetical protein
VPHNGAGEFKAAEIFRMSSLRYTLLALEMLHGFDRTLVAAVLMRIQRNVAAPHPSTSPEIPALQLDRLI